jgi:hypothetical protein
MKEALSLYHQRKKYVTKGAMNTIFSIQKSLSIINCEIFEMDTHPVVILSEK